MSATRTTHNGSRVAKAANKPPHTAQLVDPQEALGAGDSHVVYGLLPLELAETAYGKLVEEVQWIRMMHRGMALSLSVYCASAVVAESWNGCRWRSAKAGRATRRDFG